jgi:hypothetical protein
MCWLSSVSSTAHVCHGRDVASLFVRGNEWEAGNVVKVNYREPSWPASKSSAPYQVKLDKGALIYAPEDIDEYIQVLSSHSSPQLLLQIQGQIIG